MCIWSRIENNFRSKSKWIGAAGMTDDSLNSFYLIDEKWLKSSVSEIFKYNWWNLIQTNDVE
jgi:hypothetical protein